MVWIYTYAVFKRQRRTKENNKCKFKVNTVIIVKY